MQKTSFGLTASQKKHFYSQELFDGQLHLKKNLRFVIVFICSFEVIRIFLIESQRKTPQNTAYQTWIGNTITSLGSAFYFLSTFKCMERHLFNRIDLRSLLIKLSCFGLSLGSFFRAYWEFKFALDANDFETWLDRFSICLNLGFGIVYTDVLFPNWIQKLMLPFGVFVGLLIPIIQADSVNSFVLVFRVISTLIYIICLYAFKDRFRWKLFLKKIEDETWKALHTKILEEIPTSIAILDSDHGKIVYTNEEFKRFSNKQDPNEVFRNVKNLKKRRPHDEFFRSLDSGPLVDNNNSHPSVNLDMLPDTMRKARTTEDCYQESRPQNDFGQTSSTVLYDRLRDLFSNKSKKAMKSSWFGVYDGVYYEPNQIESSVEVKIFRIEQYPTAVIIMINDTTQRDVIVSLQSNNKYKDNLLASISHELRTPLNGTLGLLETALHSESESLSLKENFLLPALRSGQLLVHIINDILDYSQLGLNKISLALQDLSIMQSLRDCYSLMELQAKRKGLRFSLVLHSNIPQTFVTDHNRVKQILLNLISNAIKFTFDGEIQIEAKMLSRYILDISVSDTGIGLKTEEVEKIFFESAKSFKVFPGEKLTKNCAGLGLGLIVAHNLAKLLGPPNNEGIIIESQEGNGSKFTFHIQKKSVTIDSIASVNMHHRQEIDSRELLELFKGDAGSSLDEFSEKIISPAAQLDNGHKYCFATNLKTITPRIMSSSLDSPALEKMVEDKDRTGDQNTKILIVDDDSFNIIALESLIKSFGLKADSAYNGKEAVSKIIQRKEQGQFRDNYKLILMDFNMPVMDGRETTRVLKNLMKEGELPKIKIVGCTAFNTKKDMDTGITSGMSEIITKPVTKDKLLPILKRYVSRNLQ